MRLIAERNLSQRIRFGRCGGVCPSQFDEREKSIWPIRQILQEDELLSTWLARSAYHLQVPVRSLVDMNIRGRPNSRWYNDIDVCIDSEVAFHLSEQSGVPIQRIIRASLLRYEGTALEMAPRSSDTCWVLGSNLSPIGGRIGYAICSKCLASDDVPYFRPHWRLATTCTCERHGTLLRDRCAECGAFIFPWRGKQVSTDPLDYCTCYKCGADIIHQVDGTIPADCYTKGVALFSQITRQLDHGIIRLPCGSSDQYLILVLRGIHSLVQSLAMLRGENSLMRSLDRVCNYQFGFLDWGTLGRRLSRVAPGTVASFSLQYGVRYSAN
ncbi:TniQ family protein [Herbaspirillum rubrisubalbicans]|uniref:TniQ family protein n=1 Tax=Herbaspirillum rubrisubalbicans TaxID=80842 RepID=UPI0013DD9E4E